MTFANSELERNLLKNLSPCGRALQALDDLFNCASSIRFIVKYPRLSISIHTSGYTVYFLQ